MAYWRMQLHPAKPKAAVQHTVTSLAAGFIGLDFDRDVGNLLRVDKDQLPDGQQGYWDFAHKMKPGDFVLIMAHHYPVALVKVDGPYNYIRKPKQYVGVWFRHFRPVKLVSYYADWATDAHSWQRISMTNTIAPLNDKAKKSYQLIEHWVRDL